MPPSPAAQEEHLVQKGRSPRAQRPGPVRWTGVCWAGVCRARRGAVHLLPGRRFRARTAWTESLGVAGVPFTLIFTISETRKPVSCRLRVSFVKCNNTQKGPHY